MYFKMGCLCTIVSRYSDRKELWTAQIYKYFETALLDMLHAEKCIAKKKFNYHFHFCKRETGTDGLF